MRLSWCPINIRRRRTSLLGRVSFLLVSITISCWILLLILQNAHEQTAVSRNGRPYWYSSVYDAGLAQDEKSSQTGSNSSSVGGNGRDPHYVISNGRLPKEVRVYPNAPSSDQQQMEKLPDQLPAPHNNSQDPERQAESRSKEVSNKGDASERITERAPPRDDVRLDTIPSQNGPDSLQLLRQLILKQNQEQKVLNADRFSPLSEGGLVLVVQVHRREGYLKQLLESLRTAREIESVLLVISHDYYYDEMNSIVQSVDFCRVIQIFYPNALQLFPDTFPGQSKNDCPRDVTKQKARELNCTNAEHPDSYGHYREAGVTAIKHHWWWKVNMVFDRIRETRNFSGYVLFLEEDHYVSSDFVVMAKKLRELKQQQCEDCDFINLGMYNNVKSYAGLSNRATVGIWNAGKNNMGFGMDRKMWNAIKSCSKHFCEYDDYNWDWSLNALAKVCLERQMKVLVLRAPRILHIGTCGTHHHRSCNEVEQARIARDKLNAQHSHFFPEALHLDSGIYPSAPRKAFKNYGGWGDTRDHRLCLSFIQEDTS